MAALYPIFILILVYLGYLAIQLVVRVGLALIQFTLFLALAYVAYLASRTLLKNRYFGSKEFRAHKTALASVVTEHNEVATYISEIRARGSFNLGESSSGSRAHLAAFQNTSARGYRRDRNMANYEAPTVHNCSLQIVRNAKAEPIKYFMKYFNVQATEESLDEVEGVGNSIARLEEAIANLSSRQTDITESINPPRFILKHYANEFMERVGVELSPVSVPYPQYVFEYVSAGGNSGQRTEIILNTATVDALIETLHQTIRWRKSAAGQRSLMTARLRERIKMRDNFTCQTCSVSIHQEPHLLLEVDHITPLSLGGLSVEQNLQTLCWRCNRTKSNKVGGA